jgi:hypothetical protein
MIEKAAWLLLGLVHLMPAMAFFRPAMLKQLYRLEPGNPLFLLMHHRAALFLLVLVMCIWSAIDPAPRRLASLAVTISMLSFLWLYRRAGMPPALKKIANVDFLGLPALAYVLWNAFA